MTGISPDPQDLAMQYSAASWSAQQQAHSHAKLAHQQVLES